MLQSIPNLGTIKKGKVTKISLKSVTLESGEELQFDYAVIATGATHSGVGQVQAKSMTLAERKAELKVCSGSLGLPAAPVSSVSLSLSPQPQAKCVPVVNYSLSLGMDIDASSVESPCIPAPLCATGSFRPPSAPPTYSLTPISSSTPVPSLSCSAIHCRWLQSQSSRPQISLWWEEGRWGSRWVGGIKKGQFDLRLACVT